MRKYLVVFGLLLVSNCVSFNNFNKKTDQLLRLTIEKLETDIPFMFYYSSDYDENTEKKYPRMDMYFHSEFKNQQDEMKDFFLEEIVGKGVEDLSWTFLTKKNDVLLINYDDIRNYHFVNIDTVINVKNLYLYLDQKGIIDIYHFLKPIKIDYQLNSYFITGVESKTSKSYYLFKAIDNEGLEYVKSKSIYNKKIY
jgi:hypothetical protein